MVTEDAVAELRTETSGAVLEAKTVAGIWRPGGSRRKWTEHFIRHDGGNRDAVGFPESRATRIVGDNQE